MARPDTLQLCARIWWEDQPERLTRDLDDLAAHGLAPRHGEMTVVEDGDDLTAVVALSVEGDATMPAGLTDAHPLRHSTRHKQSYWRRVPAELHLLWFQASARRGEQA